MYIDIILFAVLAAVLATNLYKILGKKAISEDAISSENNNNIEEEKKIFSNEIMDYSRKQVIDLDKDFSFTVFLDGAKSAFTLIVNAYKNKKIQDVKELLDSNVYDNFKESINKIVDKEEEIKTFQILSLQSSIANIEVIKKLVKIKVEFISLQEKTLENDTKTSKEIKDIWVFEREMDSESLIWKLVEVSSK